MTPVRPALAFPFNDPDGTLFQHLHAILPILKSHFACAYICPPLSMWKHAGNLQQLQADDFFTLFPAECEMQVSERFAYLYRRAAEAAPIASWKELSPQLGETCLAENWTMRGAYCRSRGRAS
jgi:hypothetical protein